MKKQTWMPHPGHFCAGEQCQFRMNTHVNGYIVSTVGELKLSHKHDSKEFEDIGWGRKYETMVFKAQKSKHKCCPYVMSSASELDTAGYNTADDAYAGHMKMLRKWAKK